MRFIGDVHGKMFAYAAICSTVDETIQVGDMGIGFVDKIPTSKNNRFIRGNNRFIRGNHDDPLLCRRTDGWIADGHVENDTMFIGGAWSIDYAWRTPMVNWWPDEECTNPQFDVFSDRYKTEKPKIMVTHDCPASVAYTLFLQENNMRQHQTKTGNRLQEMFEIHQPDIWIFGHWHLRKDQVIEGTRFICLEELGFIDL